MGQSGVVADAGEVNAAGGLQAPGIASVPGDGVAALGQDSVVQFLYQAAGNIEYFQLQRWSSSTARAMVVLGLKGLG